MASPLFRKSILALAVLTAPHAIAATVHLTGSPAAINVSMLDDLTVTGAASGTASDSQVLSIWPWGQVGNITNQANLSNQADNGIALNIEPGSLFAGYISTLSNEGQISSNGINSSAISLGTDPLVGLGLVSIDGLMSNSGTVESTGSASAGIRLKAFQATSGLLNTGTISASGEQASGIICSSICLLLGNLENRGSISAVGSNSSAINLATAVLQNTLINSGTLQSSGNNSTAVILGSEAGLFNQDSGRILASGIGSRAVHFTGTASDEQAHISQSGLISAEGSESIALYLETPANIDWLENQGSIQASGAGSRAIVLGNRYFDEPSNQSASAIISRGGRIEADGIGIDIAATPDLYQGVANWAEIELNNSLLSGGQTAVRAQGNAVLASRSSDIRGDLLGLKHVSLQNSRFDGSRIQASELFYLQDNVEFLQPHTQLDGNAHILSGSTLVLNLSPQTNAGSSILQGTGEVLLNNSSEISFALKATPADFNPGAQRTYTLLGAPELNYSTGFAENIRVTSLSELLKIHSYQLSNTSIVATVGGLSTTEATEQLRDLGAPGHVLPAYGAFYGSVLGQLDADDALFQRFTEGSSQQLLELASQLTPDASGGTFRTHIGNQNLLAGSLQQRGSLLRQGMSSGDGLSETGAWVTLLDSDADQSSRGGVSGYDADSQGILVGADGKLNEQTTLGLAYSYLDSDIHGASSKTESDAHSLSLYGSWEHQAWFVDGNLSLGLADNDSTRHVAGTRAEGNYDSQLYGAALIGGYRYPLQQNLELEARLGARYNRIDSDSYREHGSSAALAVDDQRFEAGELGAGIRLAGLLPLGEGQLKPQLTLMAWHDLIADQGSQNSSFLVGGSPFITNGSEPTRDSYEARLGVDYELGAVTLGLGYDYLGKADFSSDTLSAKLRYDF